MLGIDVGDEAAGMPLGDETSVVVGETMYGVVVWDMVDRLSCVVQEFPMRNPSHGRLMVIYIAIVMFHEVILTCRPPFVY